MSTNGMKVTLDPKGKTLTIVIPCDPKAEVVSSTGKTRNVATSHGNRPTDITVAGKTLCVGVNAYISNR